VRGSVSQFSFEGAVEDGVELGGGSYSQALYHRTEYISELFQTLHEPRKKLRPFCFIQSSSNHEVCSV